MKHTFEEFALSAQAEVLPPTAEQVLHARIDALERDLRSFQTGLGSYEEWFKRHINQLCQYAAETLTTRVRELIEEELSAGGVKISTEQINSVVDEVLHEAYPGLKKAILSHVQPHALKR